MNAIIQIFEIEPHIFIDDRWISQSGHRDEHGNVIIHPGEGQKKSREVAIHAVNLLPDTGIAEHRAVRKRLGE